MSVIGVAVTFLICIYLLRPMFYMYYVNGKNLKLYCIVFYYYAQKGCLGMCEILTKNGRHFVIELISVEQGFKIK